MFTLSECKYIGIRNFEFVAKTQFLFKKSTFRTFNFVIYENFQKNADLPPKTKDYSCYSLIQC